MSTWKKRAEGASVLVEPGRAARPGRSPNPVCRAAGCTRGSRSSRSSSSSLDPQLLLRGGPLLPSSPGQEGGVCWLPEGPRASGQQTLPTCTWAWDLEATQPQNNLQSGHPVLPAEPPETPPAPPGSTEPPSGLGSGHEHGLRTLALRVPLNTCSPTQVPGAGGCWALTSLPSDARGAGGTRTQDAEHQNQGRAEGRGASVLNVRV